MASPTFVLTDGKLTVRDGQFVIDPNPDGATFGLCCWLQFFDCDDDTPTGVYGQVPQGTAALIDEQCSYAGGESTACPGEETVLPAETVLYPLGCPCVSDVGPCPEDNDYPGWENNILVMLDWGASGCFGLGMTEFMVLEPTGLGGWIWNDAPEQESGAIYCLGDYFYFNYTNSTHDCNLTWRIVRGTTNEVPSDGNWFFVPEETNCCGTELGDPIATITVDPPP